MPIHVQVVSREKLVFEIEDADSVQIPAAEGEMGVLPNHAPVLTTLGFGDLVIRRGGAEEHFAVYGGVVDVRPNKVTVLAEVAESAFDLDIQAIEAARANAAKIMAEGLPPEQNRDVALALRRAEIAMRVSRKIQQRGPSILRIISEEDES